jgi:hypothetical protein
MILGIAEKAMQTMRQEMIAPGDCFGSKREQPG